jgi:hypothetical protein
MLPGQPTEPGQVAGVVLTELMLTRFLRVTSLELKIANPAAAPCADAGETAAIRTAKPSTPT